MEKVLPKKRKEEAGSFTFKFGAEAEFHAVFYVIPHLRAVVDLFYPE